MVNINKSCRSYYSDSKILNNVGRHGSLKFGIICQRHKLPQVENNSVSQVFTKNMAFNVCTAHSSNGPSVGFSTKLIDKPKTVNKKQKTDLTHKLLQCIAKKTPSLVKVVQLIAEGADLNLRATNNSRLPLEVAVIRRDLELVRLLRANGAQCSVGMINRCFRGKGNLAMLKLLLERVGPSIFKRDVGNNTLLDRAVATENKEIIDYLITKGAVISTGPLAKLIEEKKFDLVKLLLPALPDSKVNSRIQGDTLMWYAHCSGNDEIIDALVKRGGTFSFMRALKCCSWTDLESFLKGPRGKILYHPELLKGISRSGQKTLLGQAMCSGHLEAAKFLRQKGAIISATELAVQVQKGHTDLVALFIGGLPANQIDCRIHGRTLLSYAIETADFKMLKLMIEAGANLNCYSKLVVGYANGNMWGPDPVKREVLPLWQAIPKESDTGNGYSTVKLKQGNALMAKALLDAGAKLNPELWELEAFREQFSKDILWKHRPEAKQMLQVAHAFRQGYPFNTGGMFMGFDRSTPSLWPIVRAMESTGTFDVAQELRKGVPLANLDLQSAFNPLLLSVDLDWEARLKKARYYSDLGKSYRECYDSTIPFARLKDEKVLKAVASNKKLANLLLKMGLEELAESCFKKTCAKYDSKLKKEEIERHIETMHQALVALLESKAEISPQLIELYRNNRGITVGVRQALLERAGDGQALSESSPSSSSSSSSK